MCLAMQKPIIFLFLLSLMALGCSRKSLELSSPNEALRFTISVDSEKRLNYTISRNDSLVIGKSLMGFTLNNGWAAGEEVRIIGTEFSQFDAMWSPVYGEQSYYRDHYKQLVLELVDIHTDEELIVTIRAYDEGLAFRYTFPGETEKTIVRENTQFTFPSGTEFWASYRAQRQIIKLTLSEITDSCERPILAEINDCTYVAVGEAALVDFARMKFIPDPGGSHALLASLSGEVTSNSSLTSPWRYVMLADSPARLLENNFMLLNLNEPNRIKNYSWIKPGKVIRDVTLSTRGGMACVDFAASHGLQYIEYDAGWYGPQYDPGTDATSVFVDPGRSSGELDLQKVIDYGKEKGIGVILYVNQHALENQLDEILPLYKSWGVAGLKFGFVEVGSQKWTSWLHEAVRKCADFQLMVDIHDEYRPTGYSRTYPNLMTQEGIRGDEETPRNETAINTIFTRMIAGAGDQTNCYFAERVGTSMGTHASQMAKAICIYSPWLFTYWYDRPQGSPGADNGNGGSKQFIPEIPDLDFYAKLPTVWDETRVLDGYPGRNALIARRSGEDWFVGALNGPGDRQFTIELDFLKEGKSYEAEIYSHNPSLRTRTKVQISKIAVDRNSVISQNVSQENGMAVILTPIN